MRIAFVGSVALIVGTVMACGSADDRSVQGTDTRGEPARDSGRADAENAVESEADGGKLDGGSGGDGRSDGAAGDANGDAGDASNDGSALADGGLADGAFTTHDASFLDAAVTDATRPDGGPSVGPITGGPCQSGAVGATAFRVKWVNAGGQAQPSYEVNGLPDPSRWKTGAYGYQIGFAAAFVDPFLGAGGVQLDDSDFIDIELSTVGPSVIRSVTLAILGRSYDTTTDGSFNWQTFVGTGSTALGTVSNAAPYTWTLADATPDFIAGDAKARLRIKAGPPSSALVVNKIELCIDAD